jgi:PqqD family protein of HPr-rel-A system
MSFADKEVSMSNVLQLKNLAISETGFVFDPRSGATFSLNSTGLAILNSLREGHDLPTIMARLEAAFDVVGETVAHDVRELVQALQRHGVLSAEYKL